MSRGCTLCTTSDGRTSKACEEGKGEAASGRGEEGTGEELRRRRAEQSRAAHDMMRAEPLVKMRRTSSSSMTSLTKVCLLPLLPPPFPVVFLFFRSFPPNSFSSLPFSFSTSSYFSPLSSSSFPPPSPLPLPLLLPTLFLFFSSCLLHYQPTTWNGPRRSPPGRSGRRNAIG